MKLFARKLRERAKQLGISNAEVARRAGLEEARYAHYASGRREPNLAIVIKIADVLGTSPNWLLGVTELKDKDPAKSALIDRFTNAAAHMSTENVEICVIQAEAVAAKEGH